MFWQKQQVSSPHIEALLNREDCTIYDLMDDDDILQECKSQNKKLLEFLTRSNVMDELISLITQDPPNDVCPSQRFRYPHIACEILSCDIPMINEKLAGMRARIWKRSVKQLDFWMKIWKIHGIKMWCKEGDIGLLQKLYSFIDTEEPLNPLLASFFSKAMGILVVRSKDQNWYSYQFTCLQVFAFLKSREKCIDLLLYHLETSAIMNLLLKLVTEVEGAETRQNFLDWLDSQELVQRLVKLLSPHCQPSRHSNVAQLLRDMINGVREISKDSSERSVESDPILCTLESEETTKLLLDTILDDEKQESSIVGGIRVLLKLLKPTTNSNSNDQNSPIEKAAENVMKIRISNATIPYFEKFHDLLRNPPYMPPVKTTAGVLQVPVGNTRLHILELLATLLGAENPNVRAKMVELDMFRTFLDLFFDYPLNNFLHTQVQNALREALASVFPESDESYYEYVFVKCLLISRISNTFAENEKTRGRLGNMGHVIEITKDIASQCEKNNVLDTFITANLPEEMVTSWQNIVFKNLPCIQTLQKTLCSSKFIVADNESNTSEYTYSENMFGPQGQAMEPHYSNICDYRNDVYKEDNMMNADFLNEGSGHPSSITLSTEDQIANEQLFNQLCELRQKRDDTAWWPEENTSLNSNLQTGSSSSDEEDENEKDEDVTKPLDFWMQSSLIKWNTEELEVPDTNIWDCDSASNRNSEDNWASFTDVFKTDDDSSKVPQEIMNNPSSIGEHSHQNPFIDYPLPIIEDSLLKNKAPIYYRCKTFSSATTDLPQTLDDDESWANFSANFEQALSFTTADNNEASLVAKETPQEEVAINTPSDVEQNLETNLETNVVNKNTTPCVDQTVTDSESVNAQTSDDDNANPIVMIENRIPEVTEEQQNCDKKVQNTEEIVHSEDSAPLVNTVENNSEDVNKST